MIELINAKYLLPTKDFRALSVLNVINKTPDVSQNVIGKLTNLSSSMVNNYIKFFKREGLLKVTGKTNRTIKYHLTDEGLKKLSKSILSYSAEIVQLYSLVKKDIEIILNGFYDEGIRTVVLFGAAETAEVVYAAMKNTALVMIGIVDSDHTKHGNIFNGLKICEPSEIKVIKPDGVIITSFGRQEEIYKYLLGLIGDSILIKKLAEF